MAPPRVYLPTLLVATANAYVWPNPRLDDIESARWDADGWNVRTSIMSGLKPCDFFFRGPNKGRSNAADWIRTAFHDMATHDTVTGTGGMDASIRFETSRAENAGTGFSNTISFFRGDPGRYLSMADVLGLAMVYSVENCGGPEVDFRGGRIDAAVANDPGVPEPQGTLPDHVTAFARMGFNQSEMIGLVACGHTIGTGVQKTAFPDLVPDFNDPTNEENNAGFDSTVVHFDNNVAKEYVAGTTANPLVVNPLDEFNSDKRIFGSDGNQTMLAFSRDAAHFAQTCATLLSRMIDVVPRGVQLTEVIKPLLVKPHGLELVHKGTGALAFKGEVRLWNPLVNAARKVRMVWSDRNGVKTAVPLAHLPEMVGSAAGGRYRSEWYSWNIVPNANSTAGRITEQLGVTGVHFEVDEGTGSAVKIEDQQGLGFPVSDTVIFSETSCKTSDGWPSLGRYGVAVRRDARPHRVYLTGNGGFVNGLPSFFTIDISPPANSSGTAPYEIWTVELNEDQVFQSFTLSFEKDASGVHLDVAEERMPFNFPLCT
ncbi:putative L-ascorbate oxidase [Auricularia subglabra TFB-10046 SS5]|nr:putative L-ascorbate oxidase [Auricularia subglabra TFB-10046 SS5]